MILPLLTVAILSENDIVFLRQRTRRTAELLGFGPEDQTRIATAVSEIARNAQSYGGGGRAELLMDGGAPHRRFVIRITDKGPGVPDLPAILADKPRSIPGMGLGIAGARRLMDRFEIQSSGLGTCVTLEKRLPMSAAAAGWSIDRVAAQLSLDVAADPLAEFRVQNHELMRALQINTDRQNELALLNAELVEANREMTLLHAELDRRAEQLKAFNTSLEAGIAAALEERNRTEEQLRQSQKMDALGQLTGGVAHDFNNLLQVIVGNLEFLDRHLPDDAARCRRAASTAMEGALRAADLTHRLLAFSRLQPLNPKPIDVGSLTRGMFDILSRTLGQGLDMTISVEPDLWFAEADPHQLENAILNLAVNARHAMTDGGTVAIRAFNSDAASSAALPDLPAGEHVAVSVTDTGIGIPAEILARVFEPFFTTKDVGLGTGLGLSQVYGFAKQSKGDVRIASEVGVGTSVTIYLPRSYGLPIVDFVASMEPAMRASQGETILVVEDDGQVQNYTVEALRELGYEVHRTAEGGSALALLQRTLKVDLLFTDVMLPGALNGRDLAEKAQELRPDMKVLFTSGYSQDVIVKKGRLDPEIDLLVKPFSYRDLAIRVRRTLDQGSAADLAAS
jgi:signal transduction histidine kinase/CheY-like chemotaxis protein